MMITLQSYVRRGKHRLRALAVDPRAHLAARIVAHFLAGLGLSAASLGNVPLPFAISFVCVCSGWPCLVAGLGSALGYYIFWGAAGQQGLFWTAAATAAALVFNELRATRNAPLLMPAVAGLIVSAGGVLFQLWMQDTTPVSLYLLRVVLAVSGCALFARVLRGRDPIMDWLACGIGILALAQIAPLPWLSLGYLAAGCIAAAGAFPAVAITGLALDLAQVTPVPMTAVLCGSFLVRFLPRRSKTAGILAPAFAFLLIMTLCSRWDLNPLPGLLLGSIAGNLLPGPQKVAHRRGETGAAQVRLEMAAGVLAQTEQVLLEAPVAPVDDNALVSRAADRACSNCSYRKACKDARKLEQLPGLLLHKPLLTTDELPIICRKSGRFLAELHRSQEQLRSIRADRERQREYRAAVVQQFQFLSEFLQDLSDQLSRRCDPSAPFYTPRVQVCGNRREGENGDRCLYFAGTRNLYYVLLCDGMGTGLGAVQEGKDACNMLKRLLTAGYPAEHALRSLNSLCALRERAGAVTVDLFEVDLNTGKGTLYKWGAAPSYLVTNLGAEKIGTAGPPPGLSVTDYRETADRLSLRRGETLVLISDGVGEEEALHCCLRMAGRSPGELATALLSCGQLGGQDDATVAVVTLHPGTATP